MHTAERYILRFLLCSVLPLLFSSLRADAQSSEYGYGWDRMWGSAAPLFVQDTLEICFMGDVMMHSAQIDNARRKDGSYDFSTYFQHIEDRISKADLAIANMEFTLGGEPYSGYPCFSAPDALADYCADCGFDLFLCANNHIFDTGSKGAERTLERYRELEISKGIKFTGLAGNETEYSRNFPLMIRRKGISLALVNFTYGTNIGGSAKWPKVNYEADKRAISEALSKAMEADCDYAVALPHWGQEYKLQHSDSQEKTAKWLISEGTDMIIGAHPHVVQDMQMIEGSPVVYSLGNAVSNMSAANTQIELMATVRIARHGNGDLEMLPLEFTYLWCSRPGGYCSSYTVLPIKDYIGRRAEWQGYWDYDKMVSSYRRVMEETGIKDGPTDENE